MNADLEALKNLQVVDVEIAALEAEIASQPRLVAAIESRLNAARQKVADARAAIEENKRNRRRLEQETQSGNEKIIKFREQSSSVKTNEQYKALLKEIADGEAAVRALEDQTLDLEFAMEPLQKALAGAEAALTADTAVIEGEKAALDARIQQTAQRVAELREQSKGLRQGIDENLLLHYGRVLKKRGSAVAAARDMRCQGCMVALRQQVYAQLQSGGEIVLCDSCARILYYDGDSQQEAADAASNSTLVEREWAYLPSFGEHGAFVAFVSSKGTATLRAYDAISGALLDRRTVKGQTYRLAFASELEQGRTIFIDETAAEEKFKTQLPPEILEEMRQQLPSEAGV
jgi:hypothetical protein